MERVNLLPMSVRSARWRRRAIMAWGGVLSVAGLAAGILIFRTNLNIGDGEREMSRLIDERVRNSTALREQIGRASASLAQIQKELVVADRIQSRPEWSLLLATLGGLVGPDVAIEQCRVVETATPAPKPPPAILKKDDKRPAKVEGYQLQLVGAARDQEVVAGLVLALERTGLFSKTQLVQTRRRSLLEGEAVGFEIKADMAAMVEVRP